MNFAFKQSVFFTKYLFLSIISILFVKVLHFYLKFSHYFMFAKFRIIFWQNFRIIFLAKFSPYFFAKFSHFLFCENFLFFFAKQIKAKFRKKGKNFRIFASERNAQMKRNSREKNAKFSWKRFFLFAGNPIVGFLVWFH